MENNKKSKYFAAGTPQDTARDALKRSESFFNTLTANSYLEKLASMWRAYHGIYGGGRSGSHEISFDGDQGELVNLPINHFRNLAQHILVMITANRPILEARAVNTDYKSQAQTYLANGILEYYMREKRLEDAVKKATELAIVLGAGFIKMEWNATSGEIYDVDPETDIPIYEGDIEFSTLTPFDVVVDGTKENWDHDWMIARSYQNKYNLIAKYPDLADKLEGLDTKSTKNQYRMASWSNDETDDIPVYEFYHKQSEALPNGRYMLFASEDIVLIDTALPYREIPIYRISPGDILGTPYGYSPMFDVFPIQEGINSLFGAVMTNQAAFGVQNIFVPRGADISINNLEGAMNIIEGNAKPEALNLTQTPAEVFKFIDMLIQSAETISGVNSVARGNPEASLKSGTALALVQSMAIQFISGLQRSYVRLIEDSGTAVINMIKDFGTTPKVVALVGKNNRSYLKEFTGESLSAINRVIVDVGNPLGRTLAGRVQMAEQLIQMKLVKNPAQYFQVLNTGRIEPMFEDEMDQFLLIQSENERILEGEKVSATILDNHRIHIMDHRKVFNDPDLRKDQGLLALALDHIQEHIDLLRNGDPDLLQLIGEQPLNPPGQMPPNGALPPGPMAPQPSQASLQGSPMNAMMTNNQGLPMGGEAIASGEMTEAIPQIPGVDGSLLPNPELQQASMGNVK